MFVLHLVPMRQGDRPVMLYPHALKDAVDSLSDRPPNTLLPPTYNPARPPIPERTPSLEPPTPYGVTPITRL